MKKKLGQSHKLDRKSVLFNLLPIISLALNLKDCEMIL